MGINMKLKEFLKNLNEFIKENPKALEYEVVYAIDEEGNAYNEVCFEPSDGVYKDREYVPRSALLEEPDEFSRKEEECNAVCIN